MAETNEILLTIKALEHGFGVTKMTIYNWRHGKRTNRPPLPFYERARNDGPGGKQVYFKMSEVLTWAQSNRLHFDVEKAKRHTAQ